MTRRFLTVCLSVFLLLPCLSRAAASDTEAEEKVRLPIIMYHEVKEFSLGKDVISPWEFESDLKYLRRNDYTTVTMNDLLLWFYCGATLPPNPIMLTFDDGYLSTYKYVLPLLKEYDMKIVLSLIVRDTDNFTRSPDGSIDYSHVTWPQLNEMLDTGLVEVQNHSYDLHGFSNGRYGCIRKNGEPQDNFASVLKNDLTRAQSEIFRMTDRIPTTFTYPYGRYSAETDDILKELGFQATLSCRYGLNVLTRQRPDLYRLRRLCRAHGEGLGPLLEETYQKIYRKSSPPA
jgi:peptidoglycan/xylan/chitin deacetylase (PgdA/CDA1 family)